MRRPLALVALAALPAPAHAQAYVRAGLAAERADAAGFRDVDCGRPGAVFGCGAGPDGQPMSARGRFGSTAAVEAGLGYTASPTWRVEAMAAYRPGLAFSGRGPTAGPPWRAQVSSLTALAVAWADLGVYGRLRPFLGLGVGVVRHRLAAVGPVPAGEGASAAWMAAAGVSAAVSDRLTLDLAYRYTDLGAVRSGAPAIRAALVVQGVGAGARWGF